MQFFDLSVIFYILSCLSLLIYFGFNRHFFNSTHLVLSMLGSVFAFIELAQIIKSGGNSLTLICVLISGVLGLINVFLGLKYKKKTVIGFFILPVIIIAGLTAMFSRAAMVGSGGHMAESMWFYLHLPLVSLGSVLFVVSFVSGLMFFILERELKAKRFGVIFDKFPSLATTNNINSASLYLGFVFYTAGLLAAVGWLSFHRGAGTGLFTPEFYMKIFAGLFAWLIMGIIIIIKRIGGMDARYTAFASVVGFLIMALTYGSVAAFVITQ